MTLLILHNRGIVLHCGIEMKIEETRKFEVNVKGYKAIFRVSFQSDAGKLLETSTSIRAVVVCASSLRTGFEREAKRLSGVRIGRTF